MKLYRLTILGQGPLDQIVIWDSALSSAVTEFRRATKMASATAARIERTSAVPSKSLFMKALNHQPLGLKFETVAEWDRVNGLVGIGADEFRRAEVSMRVRKRAEQRELA